MSSVETRRRVRATPEHRRKQILQEATSLIGERGYHGFGIRELAERCGLTNPSVIHYFGSKEGLLIALLEDRDLRDAELAAFAVGFPYAGAEPPVLTLRQLHDFCRAIVLRNSTRPELVRLYTVLKTEALNADHPAHEFFVMRQANVLSGFARVVAPFVSDAQSTALQLMVMMDGLQEEWLRSTQSFDLIVAWERAAAQLLPPHD